MTYDETVKLTALGNRYREIMAEHDEMATELVELNRRRDRLLRRLGDLREAMNLLVGEVEPLFAGVVRDDPAPIVVSSVAPGDTKAEA